MKLLLAALPIELTAFPEHLPGFERVTTRAGKLWASFGLTQALERGAYDEIVVVGTAGSIDPDIRGGVHEIAEAFQHDVSDEEQIRGQHVMMPARVSTGRDGVVIGTGDHFVDDADEVAVVRELGAHLVDMETYAYIWIAQQYGVPIRVVRAVSDFAQDGAAKTWDDTVVGCSTELWEWFRAEYGITA